MKHVNENINIDFFKNKKKIAMHVRRCLHLEMLIESSKITDSHDKSWDENTALKKK